MMGHDKLNYMREQPQKNGVLLMEKSPLQEVNLQTTIERLTKEEWAWMGGLIDGEGSIFMAIRHDKKVGNWKGNGIDSKICVGNTDAGIVKRYIDLLNKLGINPKIVEYGANSNNHLKQQMLYVNIGKMSQMLIVLSGIQPYLFSQKKYRAELMIQFITRRLSRIGKRGVGAGNAWYDEEDWRIAKEFKSIVNNNSFDEVLNDYTLSSNS